jgi:hypothetical protein
MGKGKEKATWRTVRLTVGPYAGSTFEEVYTSHPDFLFTMFDDDQLRGSATVEERQALLDVLAHKDAVDPYAQF